MHPSHSPHGITAYDTCPMPNNQRPPALPTINHTWPVHSPMRGLFSDMTDLAAKEDQVPPVLCAQAALAVGALALQNQVTVERPNDGSAVPVSLLVIGIAESGERKSKIISRFMQPVTDYLAAQEDGEEWLCYQKEMANWEKTHKRLTSALARACAHQLIEDSELNEEDEDDSDGEVLNDE